MLFGELFPVAQILGVNFTFENRMEKFLNGALDLQNRDHAVLLASRTTSITRLDVPRRQKAALIVSVRLSAAHLIHNTRLHPIPAVSLGSVSRYLHTFCVVSTYIKTTRSASHAW